ncbi:cytochrome c oxidase accessory protein CcoG [Bdellovibrio sp. HCB337]|uniref:cytochrome c oxidase accessory protein CcoG n=1 Tax=Bdellovibrio sp. HCB337 TaxID=3394358 RepID=UPI0039A583B6
MALDPERLTSIDEFGDRTYIIPAEVRGFFHKHRQRVHILLLFVFLVIPWTYINGQQTILLDIPARKFAIFGITFWAHDAPLVFFVLATLTLGLTFVTSVWGRVWCGWACPQTVFVEAVFRRIEQWVQGNYIQRRQLHQAELSFKKFYKKSLTWFLFFVVSSLISHSFAAYFVGSEKLLQMIQGSPQENWSYFLVISCMTALVLFDFGWFREQFCIIMCPYGRFQSVLLDQKSLAVVYDETRGEPRKGKVPPGQKQGDCVACNRCVQVCPTGIDIRKGLQMECITCTACIDACDEIMEKVKKPKGLIRYDTLDRSPVSLKKTRSVIYMVLIVLSLAGLTYNIATREKAQVFVLRAKEAPYTLIKGDQGEDLVLNHFRLQIQNQGFEKGIYLLKPTKEWQENGITLTVAQNPLNIEAGKISEWHFFVRFKPELVSATGQFPVKIQLEDQNELESPFKSEKEIILVGPRK